MKKFSRVLMYLLILEWVLSSQFATSRQSARQARYQLETVPAVVEPGAQTPAQTPTEREPGSPGTGSNGGHF